MTVNVTIALDQLASASGRANQVLNHLGPVSEKGIARFNPLYISRDVRQSIRGAQRTFDGIGGRIAELEGRIGSLGGSRQTIAGAENVSTALHAALDGLDAGGPIGPELLQGIRTGVAEYLSGVDAMRSAFYEGRSTGRFAATLA